MPDWSYHPIFRPLLFRLPAKMARDLTLTAIGRLARLPGGPLIIETMGHMSPPNELHREKWGISFPTPLGLGAGLDVQGTGLPALAQFGFGYIEAGPVTLQPILSDEPFKRDTDERAIHYPSPLENEGVECLTARLTKLGSLPVPVSVRLAHKPGADALGAAEERIQVAQALAPHSQFFVLDTSQQTKPEKFSFPRTVNCTFLHVNLKF